MTRGLLSACLWCGVGSIALVWVCVGVCGCVWVCVGVCGCGWLCVGGYVWVRVGVCGYNTGYVWKGEDDRTNFIIANSSKLPPRSTVLLILASQRIDPLTEELEGGSSRKNIRNSKLTSVEWMILAYVAGE